MPSEIVIPHETVNDTTVTVALLYVAHGAVVQQGDLLAEIETSKSNISLEAESEGYIEWLHEVGDEVDAGACIGKLHQDKSSIPAPSNRSQKPHPPTTSPPLVEQPAAPEIERDEAHSPSRPAEGRDAFPYISEAAKFSESAHRSIPHESTTPGLKHTSTTSPSTSGKSRKQASAQSISIPTRPIPELRANVRYDLYRYQRATGWKPFLRALWYEPGFRAILIYRLAKAAEKNVLSRIFLFPILSFLRKVSQLFHGFSIPFDAVIGPGLCFPHWGGIWINRGVHIGANVTIGHDVSIGTAGPNAKGHPLIGDRVYLSPGARITGSITLGADVLVTANALVVSNAPDGAILVGVPAEEKGHQDENRFSINIHPDFDAPSGVSETGKPSDDD